MEESDQALTEGPAGHDEIERPAHCRPTSTADPNPEDEHVTLNWITTTNQP